MLPPYVPEALARLPQWVFWQAELTPQGKPTKVPYQVDNWKRLAASTRPEEWATYADLETNFNVANRTGAGFVFAPGGGVFGIDIDDISKIASEDQDASMRLRAMIHEYFPTYCEISPSGTGRHYLGFGSLPEEIRSIKDSKYGIEIYDKERFFTFTGDTIDPFRTELVDCQSALTELAHTMRQSVVAARGSYTDETDERSLDQIVADTSAWSNGAEFVKLMTEPLPSILARFKQDHSAADLALCNFIATATQDQEKAVELFRRSALWRDGGKGGYKPESKYIDDYLLQRCFGKVWGENVIKARIQQKQAAEGKEIAAAIIANDPGAGSDPTSFALQFGVKLPMLNTSRKDCPMPPGIVGQFVQAVYDGCATPISEFAVAVSMAFLSGLVGRAYRFQGQGTNAFFMVGAKSSTGKTQAINSLQRLLADLDNPMIADRLYAVSGKTVQGLHPYFENAPAGAWITDECGAQVKALVEPNGQNDHELKDAINSLFDAATPGKKWRPPASLRSSKEDKSITCLSVGIAWFTTREKIYSALNNNEIADGFLSRFVPVFYNGSMGDDNPNIIDEFPAAVKHTLNTLWSVVQENDVHMPIDGVGNSSKTVKVGGTSEALEAMRHFGSEARNVTRRAQNDNDVMPEAFIAMSRVGITAQRLAAVCAVLDNPIQPTITLAHVEWAVQLVGSRMMHVLELMATGEVGSGDSIEVPTVVRVMKRLIKQHGARVPMAALHDRLRLVLPFKESRIGPMNAAKQAINNMMEEGRIVKHIEVDGTAGRPGTYYMVTGDLVWK